MHVPIKVEKGRHLLRIEHIYNFPFEGLFFKKKFVTWTSTVAWLRGTYGVMCDHDIGW